LGWVGRDLFLEVYVVFFVFNPFYIKKHHYVSTK
jgi:hypothetical protein